MSAPGDDGKSRAAVSGERLDWQDELNSAMATIDDKLQHPRRRASDIADQPTLPQLGQIDLTSELLDEIAWRVTQQIQRTQRMQGDLALAPADVPVPAPPIEPEKPPTPRDVAMVIRIRRPLLRWPFRVFRRRRHRHSLTTVRLSA